MANDRLSQQPVEVVVSPTDAEARTSQQAVEAVVLPTDADARASQQAVEVVVRPTDSEARLSQLVVEVVIENTNDQAIDVGLIDQTAVAFSPTVSFGAQTVDVALIDQTATIHTPTVTSLAAIVLGLIDQTAVANAPVVALEQDVVLGLIDQTAATHSPTVTATATIDVALINQTAATFTPTVAAGAVTISLALVNQTAQALAPTITQSSAQDIAFERITQTAEALPAVFGSQFLRPSSDVTNTGTNGFGAIDETTASDADFWWGDNNTAETLEVHLTDPADPQASTGHVVRYRIAKTNAGTVDGGGNAVTITASLYQGTTLIRADSAQTATGTWTTYSFTLTGTETDNITDYTDLRLRFVTSASGGSPANRRGGAVSWAEMEIPPVSAQGLLLGRIEQPAVSFAPTVSFGAQVVSLALIDQTASAHTPTVSSLAVVSVGLVDQTATPFTPTVASIATIILGLIDQTAAPHAPTVTPGAVTIVLGLIDRTAVAHAPVVSSGAQIVELGLIDQTAVLFSPTVTAPIFGELVVAGSGAFVQSPQANWVAGLVVEGEAILGLTAERVLPTNVESYAATIAKLPRVIVITVDGVDVTDDVRYADASFTSQVNGTPGTCSFAVKDLAHTQGFVVGNEVDVWVDGVLMWSGFVRRVRRQYSADVVDTTDPQATARWFLLEGVDVNILLQNRIVYYKPNPARAELKPSASLRDPRRAWMWREDAPVAAVVKYVLTHYTDLLADGVELSGITIAGTMNPDDPVTLTGARTVADFLRMANYLIGGIFYLTPDRRFVYRDVDIPTTNFVLADKIVGQDSVGPRDYSFTSDASKMVNDALVWGTAPGVSTVAFSREQDPTAQIEHGRWQYGEYNTTMYKQTSVDTRANALVFGNLQSRKGANVDRLSCEATVFAPVFFLGDIAWCESEVFTKATNQTEPFDDTTTVLRALLPVRRMGLTFPTKTSLRVNLLLTQDLDDPWNIYEFVFPKIRIPGVGGPPPLPEVTPGECDPTCEITDTFTRTVADGWGTNDAGYPWQAGSGSTGSASVDGSIGSLTSAASAASSTSQRFYVPLPSILTATVKFRASMDANDLVSPTGPINDITMASLSIGSDTAGRSASVQVHGRRGTGISGIETDLLFFRQNFDFVVCPIAINADTWYYLKLSVAPGQALQAKVWAATDVEPGTWVSSVTETAHATTTYDYISLANLNQEDSATVLVTDFDDLDVDGVSNCEAVQLDSYDDRTVGQSATPTLGPSTSGHDYTYFGGNSQGTIGIENGYLRMVSGSSGAFKQFVLGDGSLLPAGDGNWTGFRVKFRTSYVSSAQGDHTLQIDGLADNTVSLDLDFSVSNGRIDIGSPAGFAVEPDSLNVTWSLNSWYILDMVLDENQDWRGKFYREIDGEPVDYNLSSDGSGGPAGGGGEMSFAWAFWDNSAGHSLDIEYVEVDYTGKPCYFEDGDPGQPVGGVDIVIPASGPYCETINHSGGVNMVCATEYVQGSAMVYVNGTRLFGTDYTQNGNEGLVILDTAVSASDTVRICYQIGD